MIQCPKCKREYRHDFVLEVLREATKSEKVKRAHCGCRQKQTRRGRK